MLKRHITPELLAALHDTPVALLYGARQTGKSTLVQMLIAEGYPAVYYTFDDATVLAAAKADPAGFLTSLNDPAVIDEVQRAPELFLQIKAAVDRDRRAGRFLLTGSANVLLLPQLSESLTGRMEVLTLWPLAQEEIKETKTEFVDRVFAATFVPPRYVRVDREDLARLIVAGGYPGAIQRSPLRRQAWFRSYVTTLLQRTVRDVADIERIHEMPRLLAVLAGRTGTLLNVADLSRVTATPQTTLQRYLAVLQTLFLISLLPAWTAKARKRLLKSPKVLFADTGLAAHLVGLDHRGLLNHPELWGPFVETFVVTEVLKQGGWSDVRPTFYHFRTAKGEEVDLILEAPSGEVVGIEVKAGATAVLDDFRGLRVLAGIAGRRFRRGIVLYMGERALPFGENLHAVPLSALWGRQ